MSVLPTLNNNTAGSSAAKIRPSEEKTENWQRQLAAAIRDPHQLLSLLSLSPDEIGLLSKPKFPMLVPDSFVRRMIPGDPQDPLLRQVLPTEHELQAVSGFHADPVGDALAVKSPGILQKYGGRALLIAAGACAVNCRYCFRREYPYSDAPRRLEDWTESLAAIRDNPEIDEVILSGGDPLTLTDERLQALVSQISQLSQVRRLRVHSRLPIVLPARVTDKLLDLLRGAPLQAIMVVHANHGHEIAADCEDALQKLVNAGVPVLNQAVLLRGINDTIDAQEQLCRRLINVGVMPYYLHQLDRVTGTAHFEASRSLGLSLIEGLRERLPGYAVPRYVQEIAGEPGKTPVSSLPLPSEHRSN